MSDKRKRAEDEEAIPVSSALTVAFAQDAIKFQRDTRDLKKRRRLMKARRQKQELLPMFSPRLSALRGAQQECTMEEAMELLEMGEHAYAAKHHIEDRRTIIAMLRYAAKKLFSLNKDKAAVQQIWIWLQLRMCAATSCKLMEEAEKKIIDEFGEL